MANAGIYGQLDTQAPLKLAQIISQRPDPIAQYAQGLQLKNLMGQGELQGMQLEKGRADMAAEKAVNDAYSQGGTLSEIMDRVEKTPGGLKATIPYRKALTEQQTAKLAQAKSVLDIQGKLSGQVAADPSPETLLAAVNQFEQLTGLKADRNELAGLDTPEKIKSWALGKSLEAKDLMAKVIQFDTGATQNFGTQDPITGMPKVVATFDKQAAPSSAATWTPVQGMPGYQQSSHGEIKTISGQEPVPMVIRDGNGIERVIMANPGETAAIQGLAQVGLPGDVGQGVVTQVGKTQINQGKATKPMPSTAVKLQNEELDAIGLASTISADLGALKEIIDAGGLKLGMVENKKSEALNAMGRSTENSRNYASFKSTLEKLRNDSLRLNKGVQTEGDAVRAWNELLANINDRDLVSKRLGEIVKINDRAKDLRKLNVDNIRVNYGNEPYDFSGYTDQSPVFSPGTVEHPDYPGFSIGGN